MAGTSEAWASEATGVVAQTTQKKYITNQHQSNISHQIHHKPASTISTGQTISTPTSSTKKQTTKTKKTTTSRQAQQTYSNLVITKQTTKYQVTKQTVYPPNNKPAAHPPARPPTRPLTDPPEAQMYSPDWPLKVPHTQTQTCKHGGTTATQVTKHNNELKQATTRKNK